MTIPTLLQDALSWLAQWWSEGGWMQNLLLCLSLALFVWPLVRTCFYRHYKRLGHVDMHRAEVPDLLPSQEKFVAQMVTRLSQFDLHRPGPLWAIKGRWGDGKSFLVHALQTKLENLRAGQPSQKLAVVYIDVWRHQSERDLHWAMVEAIFSNPEVLHHAFDSYPVMRLLFRHIASTLNRFFAGLTLKAAWVEMNMGLLGQQALPLMAQRDLEQVIAHLRRAGIRTVVILDEVDRATPAAAQAAIVLTRRSLNLPGLAVVMPYVEGQLEAKVFNPLQVHVPELYQTFIAHIANSVYVDSNQQAHRRKTPTDASLNLLAPEDALTPSGVSFNDPSPQALMGAGAERDSANKRNAPRDKGAPWYLRQYEERLTSFEHRALLAFDALPPTEQRVLRDQTQEKYLSLRAVVPDISAEDASQMLRWKTLQPSLPQIEGKSLELPSLEEAARTALEAIAAVPPLREPTVRHLEGQLVVALDLVQKSAHTHFDVGERESLLGRQIQVATAAVIAWLTAQVTS